MIAAAQNAAMVNTGAPASLPESHALPGNILRKDIVVRLFGAHAKAKAGGKGKAKPAGPASSVPQPTVAPT